MPVSEMKPSTAAGSCTWVLPPHRREDSRLGMGNFPLGIDPSTAHEGHIQHQRAIGHSQACGIVRSTFDAEQGITLARKSYPLHILSLF
jgi:hypothetical protein